MTKPAASVKFLRIGQLAAKSGVSAKALRLYEARGLLRPDTHSASGYRLYGAPALARLNEIGVLKRAGFTLAEIGRLITGLLAGGKTSLKWETGPAYWAKDWAKLIMNASLLAADCLPRGGTVTVRIGPDPSVPSFHIRGEGTHIRVAEDVQRLLRGEATLGAVDARGVQPFLTHKLSRTVNAGLVLTQGDGFVELTAG